MATALKRIKSIQWLLNLNFFVRSPASWKKPCLGLRFHSDISNSKCRKIHKTFILQVEQQKVKGFFPYYSCNVLFTGYMQLVDSPCSLHDQFWSLVSLFSWQFRIHCMSALLIAFRVTYNWYITLIIMATRWFCLFCIRGDLINSASRVKRYWSDIISSA